MFIYIIPEEDRAQIQSNDSRPKRHEFGYEDWDEFYFDENTIQYYDFDYDSIFQTEFSKTLTEYLSSLWKKAQNKTDRYVSDYANPSNADYRLFWLKKEIIITNGLVSQNNYYDKYDENTKTYSDKVVQEDVTYHRWPEEFIEKRTKNIKFIWEDEGIADEKTMTKYYSTMDWIKAWERMRSNIISDMKITVMWLIQATEWVTMDEAKTLWTPAITEMAEETVSYINWDWETLPAKILSDTTYTRLDNDLAVIWQPWVTIRQLILSKLAKPF